LYFSRRRRREPHPSMSGGRKAHYVDIVATHTYWIPLSLLQISYCQDTTKPPTIQKALAVFKIHPEKQRQPCKPCYYNNQPWNLQLKTRTKSRRHRTRERKTHKNTQTQRRRNSSISQETLADDFPGAAAHRKRLATRFLSTAAPIHTPLLLLLLSLCIIVIEMFFEKRGKKKKRKNLHNKRRRRRRRRRKEGKEELWSVVVVVVGPCERDGLSSRRRCDTKACTEHNEKMKGLKIHTHTYKAQ
jgi:hypothetical protein